MIHRLIYEHELPHSGGLVLSDFRTYLSGSLVEFSAGDIIPEDKLSRIIGADRLPIRDLKKEPPRKTVILDIDTGEETTPAKEMAKLRESKKAKEEGDSEPPKEEGESINGE
ncbi:hypothetical protein [Leptospirillum ferriphilum]|uniref:Uncharacterized protein n=1 Tax=Leptospirillum ferriphilum (strain ML-04) TaxID=1048260 RepID=J9Z9T7_LEPFM|nr:hypothetical protein [Leptospirillum ferriphilum]AFS52926.1 hypothetical protein LFML04_0691 [Leptospirillum ferriphilum ML-04]